MHYEIDLLDKNGEPYYFRDVLLDGIIPKHVIEMMDPRFVSNELDLCKECPMDCHCHVLVLDQDTINKKDGSGESYSKLCTVLFHDVVRPKWKLKDIA